MYDSDIRARLGIDGTSIPGELAKARGAFQKFGQNIEQDAEKHGRSAGDKLIGGLEHKIFGARHLSGALAAALGLNIEKIAERIDEAIVGGSKEAWKAAGDLAEQNSKLIEQIILKNLSPAKLREYYQREIEKATAEENAVKPKKSYSFVKSFLKGELVEDTGGLNAEQLEKQQEAKRRGLEAQEKLNELNEKDAKTSEKLEEAQRRYDDAHGTAKQRVGRLTADILNLEDALAVKGQTKAERDALEIKMLEKKTELEKEEKDIAEKKAAKEKEITDQKTRQTNLEEHARRARLELKDDTAKLGDRTKLTLGELAALKGSGSSRDAQAAADEEARRQAFAFGSGEDNGNLSPAQIQARDKARKIEELERKAETARLSGDQQGAGDLLSQVGTMRDELVSSGFTKSDQGDSAKALREQIAKDNFEIKKTLTEIKTIEAGRYTNTP